MAELRLYSCPVALSRSHLAARVLSLHRMLRVDGVTLGDLVERPTVGLLEGLMVADIGIQELHAAQSERARQDAEARAAARQHQRR